MKKLLIKNKKIITKILCSCGLIGIPIGIVFGISAATFKINYIESNFATRTKASKIANYFSQNYRSGWNLGNENDQGWLEQPNKERKEKQIEDYHQAKFLLKNFEWGPSDQNEWKNKSLDQKNTWMKNRFNDMQIVCDGANHTVLDKSFTQSLYHGLAMFIHNDYTIEQSKLSTKVNNVFDANIFSVHWARPSQDSSIGFQTIYHEIANTTPIIHLCGFNHITPLINISTNIKKNAEGKKYCCLEGDYANSAFILYDGNVSNNQNIASVNFRADQSAFLTGIATCSYLLKNAKIYHENGRKMSVGIYGGVMLPTTLNFMGGIQRGIELFNNHILSNIVDQILENNDDALKDFPDLKKATICQWSKDNKAKIIQELSIKIVSLGNQFAHFSQSFAPGDGIGLTQQFLNRDVSAIIPVAGPQIFDSVKEIVKRKAKCFVIGVDVACENGDMQHEHQYKDVSIDDKNNISPQANNVIKFSALKDIGYIAIKQNELFHKNLNWDESEDNKNNPDPDRAVCSIGFRTNANILNGGCNISYDGWYYTMQGFKYLNFIKNNKPFSFVEAWNEEVKKTNNEIKKFDEAYYFNDESVAQKYNLYGKFLGEILKSNKLHFSQEETIVHVNDDETSSVLDWLVDNMYFIA